MSDYNYKEGLNRINDILKSNIDVEERNTIPDVDSSDYKFNNAIKGGVASMFIDIRGSSEYFKDNLPKKVAKVMRAFCSEVIEILRQNDCYKEIGIRGDCVYAIYSASNSDDLCTILEDAIYVNTFQEMFQNILSRYGFNNFKIGIGLGYADNEMVAKVGRAGTGINNLIWIGDAVIDASNLSSLGNDGEFYPIVLDKSFYLEIMDYYANEEQTYADLFKAKYSSEVKRCLYHGNVYCWF